MSASNHLLYKRELAFLAAPLLFATGDAGLVAALVRMVAWIAYAALAGFLLTGLAVGGDNSKTAWLAVAAVACVPATLAALAAGWWFAQGPQRHSYGLAHLPLWLAALLMVLSIVSVWSGDFLLASAQAVLHALTLAFAVLVGTVGSQYHIGRAAGVLARLTWMLVAAGCLLLIWELYPYYRDAALHDAKVLSRAAEEIAGRPLAVYYGLGAAIFAVAGLLVARSLYFWIEDIRHGLTMDLAGEAAPGALIKWWRHLWGQDRQQISINYSNYSNYSSGTIRVQPTLATRDTLALTPTLTFGDLVGNAEIKKKLLEAAWTWDNGGAKNGRNGILLFGEPGTGKTAIAEALAGELRLKIIKANIGSIASRWVNQTTEQLHELLDAALDAAPCVLFLDEIESLLPDRTGMSQTNAEENKVVGTFLSAVEKLRRGRVLYIGATNYKERVDPAAIREGRFDFHLEMPLPDFEARRGLVLAALAKAGKSVDEAVLDRLSRRWAGFNVPRIQEAARRAAAIATGEKVAMRDFMRALRDVQGNRAGPPESALSLSELYFDPEVKDRLAELAAIFAHIDEIERRGGSAPKGILFFGPPGTGKTSMAQALAKEAGWTFIATSGKEIAADADRLRQIRRQASDLRPAIVFIDEADDILGDRGYSGLKLHTNDLLRIIDGAGEPLPDVCWILATNRPQELDEAVFRRFPVKIELGLPSRETLRRFIDDWAQAHKTKLDKPPEIWSEEVAAALDGLAPSVVKNILQTALDGEAARSVLLDAPMSLTLQEVLKARKEMAL